MTEPEMLAGYQQMLVDAGLSAATIPLYIEDSKHFLQFLRLSRRQISQVTQVQVREFLSYLKLRGCATSTIRRHLASLRRFFDYLLQERVISSNYAAALPLFRASGTPVAHLSQEQFRMLIGCLDPFDFSDIRDLALYMLLWETGWTTQQICSLDWDKLDGLLKQMQPSTQLQRALSQYRKTLCLRFEKMNGTHPVFCNRSGEQMTRQGVAKAFKCHLRNAMLPDQFSLLSLRKKGTN